VHFYPSLARQADHQPFAEYFSYALERAERGVSIGVQELAQLSRINFGCLPQLAERHANGLPGGV
jgi:hypothetical protein